MARQGSSGPASPARLRLGGPARLTWGVVRVRGRDLVRHHASQPPCGGAILARYQPGSQVLAGTGPELGRTVAHRPPAGTSGHGSCLVGGMSRARTGSGERWRGDRRRSPSRGRPGRAPAGAPRRPGRRCTSARRTGPGGPAARRPARRAPPRARRDRRPPASCRPAPRRGRGSRASAGRRVPVRARTTRRAAPGAVAPRAWPGPRRAARRHGRTPSAGTAAPRGRTGARGSASCTCSLRATAEATSATQPAKNFSVRGP